jgi:hypothetical protein
VLPHSEREEHRADDHAGDITEEEFRVIEAEHKDSVDAADRDAKSFQELLLRKLSRR